MTVRLFFEGSVLKDETGTFDNIIDPMYRARAIAGGVFLLPDGSPMAPVAQRRMRAYVAREDSLKGVSESFVENMDFDLQDQPRWVIPGLWPWGTIPKLDGQPKAGKTTLAVELVAALNTPGARFLDHFEPTEMADDAEIWFINAETPVAHFQEALYDAGAYGDALGDDRRDLHVEHLEVMGGPSIFDLTVPSNFDLWASHFIDCMECRETGEFTAPSVVIVDGLTAILGGNTDRYGEWYPKFRELLRMVDIPNGLVIGHTTMTGSHSMGGTEALAGPDGLWTYTRNDRGRRLFSVTPRMGGVAIPPTPIAPNEDGQLRIVPSTKTRNVTQPGAQEVATVTVAPEVTTAQAVLAFVAERNSARVGPRRVEIRKAVGGDASKVDDAIAKLVKSGQLKTEKRRTASGQTAIVYLTGQEADEPLDGTKASK